MSIETVGKCLRIVPSAVFLLAVLKVQGVLTGYSNNLDFAFRLRFMIFFLLTTCKISQFKSKKIQFLFSLACGSFSHYKRRNSVKAFVFVG